jgi:hypothetical protein
LYLKAPYESASQLPIQVQDYAAAGLPNGKLKVIPDGGDTLNYSKPLELSRVCDEFIQQETVADLTIGGVK